MEGNINVKTRTAYVGLPRTASRYTWGILRRAGFTTDRADQVHTHKVPENTEGWTYLVSCRNPYQRVVSMFTIATEVWKKDFKDFGEFVEKFRFPGIWEQVEHLRNIHWIHFESIVEDLGPLCLVEPPPFKESESSKNWRDFYTPELEQVIWERYREDFERCGYIRETF